MLRSLPFISSAASRRLVAGVALAAAFALNPVGQVANVQAEELDELLGNVKKFAEAKNYPKALEEMQWVKKELEKANLERIKAFFPNDLLGMKGGELEANAALGFNNIERDYVGGGKSLKLSLLGGSGSGNNPFAAMGQMAAMFGQKAGMDTFRVSGRTATMEKSGNRPSATLNLNSGSMLKFEANRGVDADALKDLVKNFNVEDLDNYLAGKQG